MDGTQAHVITHESTSETRAAGFFGGSILEGFGAIATIALAIVGLAGVFSQTLAAIAAIVVGATMLAEGGAFEPKTIRSYEGTTESSLTHNTTGVDFQGGLATVVLSVLALLGVAPLTLLSVAVIALGATSLFSGRILIGLAAAVLGILSVVGLSSWTLVLVGFLVLGAGLLFSDSENVLSTITNRS